MSVRCINARPPSGWRHGAAQQRIERGGATVPCLSNSSVTSTHSSVTSNLRASATSFQNIVSQRPPTLASFPFGTPSIYPSPRARAEPQPPPSFLLVTVAAPLALWRAFFFPTLHPIIHLQFASSTAQARGRALGVTALSSPFPLAVEGSSRYAIADPRVSSITYLRARDRSGVRTR